MKRTVATNLRQNLGKTEDERRHHNVWRSATGKMVRRSKVWILSWPRLLDKLLMCNCTFIPCSRFKFILKSVQQNISFRCNTTDQIEGGWVGFRVVKCSDERRQARNDFKLMSDGPCDLINIVESRNIYNVVSLSKLADLSLASNKC